MDEQKEEAPLPTSRAVMDSDEEEPEQVDEQAESAEPVPLPETSPDATQDIQTPEDSSDDGGDSGGIVEPEEQGDDTGIDQHPDPDWEDSINDMARQFGGTAGEDDYQPPEASWQDEMGWQQALADRSTSI